HLPDELPDHRARRARCRAAAAPHGPREQPRPAAVRLGAAAAHGTSDGKGRGRVYSLRPVCGTLPDGCMGHDEIGDPAALRRPAGANRGGGRAMTAMVQDRTNRFAFKIATVNGTGSASANALLRQAIFRMGIPVSGKNLFPSNIQGLPTWYEIRVDADGHTARTPRFDLMVAMNVATYARDVAEVVPGGWVMYDASWPLPDALRRDDVQFIGIPFAALCNQRLTGARERILMKNIAYVGALSALLDVDPG